MKDSIILELENAITHCNNNAKNIIEKSLL